jgi:hypothetical protein
MGMHEKCIQFWFENLQGTNHLQDARLKHRQDDNIKEDISKSGVRDKSVCVRNGLIWFKRDQRWTLVNIVINLHVPYTGNFLTS